MRILIVEDSPLVQGMYGLAFSPREHELTTASEGGEALARLSESTFDVVLLDLRMPGIGRDEDAHQHSPQSEATGRRWRLGGSRRRRLAVAAASGSIDATEPVFATAESPNVGRALND